MLKNTVRVVFCDETQGEYVGETLVEDAVRKLGLPLNADLEEMIRNGDKTATIRIPNSKQQDAQTVYGISCQPWTPMDGDTCDQFE
ncbi:hypothetical protein H7X87_01995 [Acetobacteraceae bacterium]|nr:hypothetical protein [Candidatus Parcubacteria bacterium]